MFVNKPNHRSTIKMKASASCKSLPAAMSQSGAVLIVSLIMLLLLTIIGMSSMQTTTLEEKMAGNMRNKSIAFQNAEAALRAAEGFLSNTANLPIFNNTNGRYSINGTPPGVNDNWANFSSVSYAGASNEANSPPQYVIQRMPDTGGSLTEFQESQIYRITSRAVGGSDNAVVVVQSIYRR